MIRFRVVVGCYRAQEHVEETIRSILSQKGDFDLVLDFTDDASPDDTLVRAMRAARDFPEGDHRFEHNIVRVGGLANFHAAIGRAHPDEILLFMGGDGDTIEANALDSLTKLFEDPALWMTYGTFKNSDGTDTHKWKESIARGICPWTGVDLRDEIHPFLWMPLCVRAKVAKKVFPHSLKINGFYFTSSGDVALNIPIAEMCGPEHARYIREEWYTRKCHARNDTRLDAMNQMYCAWKAIGKQRYKRLPNIDAEPELEDHQLKWGLMCHPDGLSNRTMPQAIQYEEESLPVVGYRDGPPLSVEDLPAWIGELAKKSLECPRCKGQEQCWCDKTFTAQILPAIICDSDCGTEPCDECGARGPGGGMPIGGSHHSHCSKFELP